MPSPYVIGRRDSSVGIATDYGLDGRGSIPGNSKIFLFQEFRLALGPTQPPIQLVPEMVLNRGVKRTGHVADYSPPSGVELYLNFPIRLRRMLIEAQG
jgi:hypothetical protein